MGLKLEEDDFKDKYLWDFFENNTPNKKIPPNISRVLSRKLDILDSAENLNDLYSPPANRLEKLNVKENNIYSIRVNDQYRLIFKYEDGKISDIKLDPHTYHL